MSAIQKSFEQAEHCFRAGKLGQSLQLYERVMEQCKTSKNVNNLKYNTYINMSTILLQQNCFPAAKQCLLKASYLNPYRYQAYYNMSIVQISHNSNQSYLRSKFHLSKCLSLLSSEMGHLTSSLKIINRSISLWARNYKAYIYRARLYEKMGKVKLAENQYERLGFELQEHGYGAEVVMEIYAAKAGFWRRIGQGKRMEEALGGYFRAKIECKSGKGISQEGNNAQEDKNETEGIIGQEESDQGEQQVRNIVKGMVREIQQLITKISQLKKTNQQGTQFVQIQQLTSSDNLESKQIPQPSLTSFQPTLTTQQPNRTQHLSTNPKQTSKQTSFLQNPAAQTSNPSISINQDQDSAILNQKIQQLQKQIKQSGGNIPEIRDMSRNSQEENFLEFEIEKTIEEINRKKVQEESKQVSKVTGKDRKESVLLVESKINYTEEFLEQKSPRSSLLNQKAQNDNLTIKSHTSQNCQLSLQQMQEYKAFRLQVRSASMFELKSAKKQSFVKIIYNTHEDVSPKAKTQNLSWNHIFSQIPIGHDLQNEFQGDESGYQIKVEVHAKEGGWLSWHHDVLLGKGTIRLMEKGGTKCTLQDQKGKKVGVLYYKAKLIRFQE